MDIENTAAYQGRGWKARSNPLSMELGTLFSGWRVNSEWSDLKAVLLYCPRAELKSIRRPRDVQHLFPVAVPQLQRQIRALARAYRRCGVKVVEINPSQLPFTMRQVPPNLMFVRDLFFNTMEGAVISRMASRVRAGEEKFAAAALAQEGVLLRASIAGRGLFEGSADAMWVTPHLVAVGIGNRTNPEGLAQLRSILRTQGVRTVAVKMPRGVQHLLGILQIVDRDLALVRTEKAPRSLLRLLQDHGYKIVEVPESVEVKLKMGFNFVTVKRRTILMPAGCRELKALYKKAGLKIAAEVEVSQICNAAGGIGCATGILARKVVG